MFRAFKNWLLLAVFDLMYSYLIRNVDLFLASGVTVASIWHEKDPAVDILKKAVQLVELVDERRFKRITKHLDCVCDAPGGKVFARYLPKHRACLIDCEKVVNEGLDVKPEITVSQLIVRTSMNAVLNDKGIRASDERIIRLCDLETERYTQRLERFLALPEIGTEIEVELQPRSVQAEQRPIQL